MREVLGFRLFCTAIGIVTAMTDSAKALTAVDQLSDTVFICLIGTVVTHIDPLIWGGA